MGTNLRDGIEVVGLVGGRIEVHSHVLGENYEEGLEIVTAYLYRPRLKGRKARRRERRSEKKGVRR